MTYKTLTVPLTEKEWRALVTTAQGDTGHKPLLPGAGVAQGQSISAFANEREGWRVGKPYSTLARADRLTQKAWLSGFYSRQSHRTDRARE